LGIEIKEINEDPVLADEAVFYAPNIVEVSKSSAAL